MSVLLLVDEREDLFFDLAMLYFQAKCVVIQSDFGHEIEWQAHASPDAIDEQTLLREAAWVILSCGMSARVVSKVFPRFASAFMDFTSSDLILSKRRKCRADALRVFQNPRKVDAVLRFAEHTQQVGFKDFLAEISTLGPAALYGLPFFAAATSRHLAKNLGLPIAKPDRHLARLAEIYASNCVHCLCREISEIVGDPINVVDVVLWRYSSLTTRSNNVFFSCNLA